MDNPTKVKRVPYYKKPANMTVEEWQTALRKQFAAEQNFLVKNTGDHPVFSDFSLYNPESDKTYKVSVRDNINSFNYCSCPDFKINGLGTCKHIEYVLKDLRRLKRNQKYFNRVQDHNYSSLSIHYGKEKKVRLRKAPDVSFDGYETAFFDGKGYLLPGKTGQLNHFIEKAVIIDPGLRVYPDVYDFINEHQEAERKAGLTGRLFPEGISSNIFYGLIKTDLYDYQKEGVIRIVESGRILLADEMGLGKTIQAIAASEVFARYLGVKKVLIVCPTSLKYQWKREIEKFTDRDVCIVEGVVHKRCELYSTGSFFKIISYGLARNDLEEIGEWAPDLVIIDEAQRIKNWKTRTAQSVKKIDTKYALVLTGTPLENRIEELHSIVEFVDRYKLGPLYRFLDSHQVLDEHGKVTGYKNLRRINKTLEGILLRRTKKEIANQLPGRMDKNFFIELTKEQIKRHNEYYEMVCRTVNKWIKTGFLTEEERQMLLIGLNCMRMVSDSTYILDNKTKYGNKVTEIIELVSELTENPGNKIVIFSQWKKMFELIIEQLNRKGLSFVYLNGDIPAQERNNIIERFRREKELHIFLSTDAGGVGVNLQAANIIINADLPWNPAVLEQRVGRIYRLGQKKSINVYNFIAEGSIEHRILYLLDFKKSVFSGAIDEDGQDNVMLEGFLNSVRSLTEVKLDTPAGNTINDDGKLRYNAEVQVSGSAVSDPGPVYTGKPAGHNPVNNISTRNSESDPDCAIQESVTCKGVETANGKLKTGHKAGNHEHEGNHEQGGNHDLNVGETLQFQGGKRHKTIFGIVKEKVTGLFRKFFSRKAG